MLACHSSNRQTSPVDEAQPLVAIAPTISAGLQSRILTLLLGRVVDLGSMAAVRTLTTAPPDEERNDPASDLGVVMLHSGEIQAFRLSTGEQLWSRMPYAPCRTFFLAGPHVYANCGDRLLSYDHLDGHETIVDEGRRVQLGIATPDFVVSDHGGGRITLFDARDNKPIVSKVLRPLVHMQMEVDSLVPRPDAPGICFLGVVADGIFSSNEAGYTAACFDETLRPVWTKKLGFGRRAKFGYDVRQGGPTHLVLRDDIFDSDEKTQKSLRGVVIRWRDGEVTPFDDGTFATIEDEHGERITAPALLEVFAATKDLPMGNEWHRRAEAVTRVDGHRAFVLIKNEKSGLAGFDLVDKRVLFLVQAPVGQEGLSLDVVAGFPVVRSKVDAYPHVRVYDPQSGRVLYSDRRP